MGLPYLRSALWVRAVGSRMEFTRLLNHDGMTSHSEEMLLPYPLGITRHQHQDRRFTLAANVRQECVMRQDIHEIP